jgi:hypothetical protein
MLARVSSTTKHEKLTNNSPPTYTLTNTFCSGQMVAIKVLEVDGADTSALRKEISILRDCSSPYVVAFKGTYER